MKKAIILLTVIFIISCDQAAVENMDEQAYQQTQDLFSQSYVEYPFGQPKHSEIDFYRWGEVDDEYRDEAREKSSQLTRNALMIYAPLAAELNQIDRDEGFETVIANADERFSKHADSEALFLAEQMFAMKLQEVIFPDVTSNHNPIAFTSEELTDNQLDALYHLSEIFVRNGNPNADLLAVNLYHLENSVYSESVKELAIVAIENAKHWYGSELACEGCYSKENYKEASLAEGVQILESFLH